MIVRRLTGGPTLGWKSPFDETERIQRQMNMLAQYLTGSIFREPAAGVFPLMNVTEDNDLKHYRATQSERDHKRACTTGLINPLSSPQ
jgi:hypothetical protein